MNFQDLYKKIRSIDENTEVPVIEPMPVVDASGGAGASDESVGECGMMPPMGAMAPNTPPPQQDTVSMNVSMNAQGAGGIRDLMNVLKDIQDGPDHGPADALTGQPHPAEIDADPELDITMPDRHDDEEADVQVVHVGNDDELEKEAFVNEPDEQYQDQEYMNNTLAGGANKPQKMTKGGYNQSDNPLTMAAILPVAAMAGRMREGLEENIRSNLQTHYNKLKEASFVQPNSPDSAPGAIKQNPARPRPAGGSGPKAIDPVSTTPVTMKPQTVAPQANRPGLAPNGDPKLWDIQHELQKRGYKIKPDGLNGPATQQAAADAGMIDSIRQDVANPKAASTFGDIGHAIGSGIGWVETAWRNLQTGLSRGRAGMEESADLDDIKKLSGLNY
jgi:hypothetical protein